MLIFVNKKRKLVEIFTPNGRYNGNSFNLDSTFLNSNHEVDCEGLDLKALNLVGSTASTEHKCE
jgi:hypothetical protein